MRNILLSGDESLVQQGESLAVMKLRVILVHMGAFAAVLFPVTHAIAIVAVVGYFFRVGGLVVGYHRFFAHRTFECNRIMQFILAWLGAAGGFRGPLWWASVHRQHHRWSDKSGDPHSPLVNSRWHAHLGFIFEHQHTDLSLVRDFSIFPELRWLNKYHYIAPYSFMAILFFIGQWTTWLGGVGLGVSAVTWGFFVPTLIGIHSIAALNSVTHGIRPYRGVITRRYETPDFTTNCWLLAIPTLGESFHNNHHKYPYSARCGGHWWEFDLGYYMIWWLSKVRLIHSVRLVKKIDKF